ncbi:general stress protein [Virgibacillus sp. YIM 98842]|uniref:general stress protein n=1 Tax=Virgibacillus sp. YIM 98842 TaxID=2663533 RepID=UPI0013DC26B1|nr:general stress protein [Virgibacillus sp. YIM 98842]
MDKKIIGGVFSDVATTEKVIHELKDQGYSSKDISVFAHDKSKADVVEDETNMGVTTDDEGRGKNAGKGAGIGAASGGVLGALGGLVVGLGLLTIPGIGQIAAAGPLAAALTGAAVAAGGGGIIGALVGLGMPEEQAKQYESFLKNGKIIVLVEADNENEHRVYDTFLTHDTENSSMYPDRTNVSGSRRASSW